MDRCSEAEGACVHEPIDLDGDGFGAAECGGGDCDDSDPARHPGNTEVCDADGRDEDCDPSTFGSRDADRDGYFDAACCNGEVCGDDCRDTHPGAHPGEAERCDGLDNDCDGMIDERVEGTFYVDADDDGFGDGSAGAATMMGCRAPPGWSSRRGDCDDADPRANLGLPEVCDAEGRDEDCDGVANPESRCACAGTDSRPCPLPGRCAAGIEGCVDGVWSECSVEATAETCVGEDDDCDGEIDEGLRITCWPDADNDGFAAEGAEPLPSCPVMGRTGVGGCPTGRTDRDPAEGPGDCDDLTATIRPTAEERLNSIDDDCDGEIDEGTG